MNQVKAKVKAQLSTIESNLKSVELQNWLLEQWDGQLIIKISANRAVLRELATEIVKQLAESIESNSTDRQAVQYEDDNIEILVGIDCNRWTVFTTTKEKSTSFIINTEANQEYCLL